MGEPISDEDVKAFVEGKRLLLGKLPDGFGPTAVHESWLRCIDHVQSRLDAAEGERDSAVAERERYARMLNSWENEDGPFNECRATSERVACVFHCHEPAGHSGEHHGNTAGLLWATDSGKARSVIAHPPEALATSPSEEGSVECDCGNPAVVTPDGQHHVFCASLIPNQEVPT